MSFERLLNLLPAIGLTLLFAADVAHCVWYWRRGLKTTLFAIPKNLWLRGLLIVWTLGLIGYAWWRAPYEDAPDFVDPLSWRAVLWICFAGYGFLAIHDIIHRYTENRSAKQTAT